MKKSINKILSTILSLVLIMSALSVPSVLGTAAVSTEYYWTFEFDNESDLKASFYASSAQKPAIVDDNGKNVLSAYAFGGNVSHVQLPLELKADTTYYYSISYRTVSQVDSDETTGNGTVLQFFSSSDASGYSNKDKIVGSETKLVTLLSWKTLTVSETYETLSGNFTTDSTSVTDELKYLTLYYKTNKGLEQQLYIDSIDIYTDMPDVSGEYIFDFKNPTELQASFYNSSSLRPAVADDNGTEVLSMIANGSYAANAQFPFVLEKNTTYYCSISYKVVSQEDSNTDKANTTVLQFYAADYADTFGSSNKFIDTSANPKLCTIFSWAELEMSDTYTVTDYVSFTTDETITDTCKYLSLYYKTQSGFTQQIYIDKISIFTAAPQEDSYDTFERYIDFSEYKIVKGQNSYYNDKVSGSDTYFKVIEDDTAIGGAYLSYYNYTACSSWYPNWLIVMTKNGAHNSTGTGDENLRLPNNKTFRVTMRIRINDLSGTEASAFVAYGPTYKKTASTDVSITNNQVIKTGITETYGNWVDMEFIFTTPESYYVDDTDTAYDRCFIAITSPGVAIKYDIDTIKLELVSSANLYIDKDGEMTHLDTVYGQPGTDLVLPVSFVAETYIEKDTTGMVETKRFASWHSDEECTKTPILKYGNSSINLYCNDFITTTSSIENQEGYCGFDTYTAQVSGMSYDYTVSSFTDKESYTGDISLHTTLKAGKFTSFEIRNEDAFEVLNGKTYKVSFAYKTNKNVEISVGEALSNDVTGTAYSLADYTALKGDNWQTASVIVNADNSSKNGYTFAMMIFATEDSDVYIDNITVSYVTGSVGAQLDESNNIQLLMTYNCGGDNVIAINDEEYGITERGILYKSSENSAMLNLENAEKITVSSQTDLSDYYSRNPVTGATVYSVNAQGFNADDKISARGYVKLADGTVCYTDIIETAVSEISQIEPLIPNSADLTDYYVYLPVGTTFDSDITYTVNCYDSFFNKITAINNDVMQKAAYVSFSELPDESTINIPAELRSVVHSGKKDELYYELDTQFVNKKLDENGADSVNYIFITDIHYKIGATSIQAASLRNQVKAIAKMANENDMIDFVVVGGDITTGMFDSKEECLQNVYEALDPLLECQKPVLVLMGNHDDNSYHVMSSANNYTIDIDRIISDKDWNDKIIDRYVNNNGYTVAQDSNDENSKYYYYDITAKKTRVICLDSVDYDAEYDENGNITSLPIRIADGETDNKKYFCGASWWGYSENQINWLVNEALTADDDWDYIFVSHMGIDDTTNSSAVKFGAELRGVIGAYQLGKSYSNEALGISTDYTNRTGKILAYQFGHKHMELQLYSDDIALWQFCTSTASVSQNTDSTTLTNVPWKPLKRSLNTENDACFDIMSVNKSRVHKTNIGAGYNKTLNYSKETPAGDVNMDEKVDILDLIRLKKVLAGINTKRATADTDKNKQLDALDLTELRKLLLQSF